MRALLLVVLLMGAHVAAADATSNLAVAAPSELAAFQGRAAILEVRVALEGAVDVPVTWAAWIDGAPHQQGLLGAPHPTHPDQGVRVELVVLPQLTLGEHVVRFVVDVHGNLSESNEADNDATTVVDVAEGADLVLRSMEVTPTETAWGEVDPLGRQTIDIDVCNEGAPSARATLWLYVAEPQAEPSAHSSWLATLDAAPIATGGCTHLRHEFEAWGTIGEFSVQALIDAANEGNARGNDASARGARLVEGHGQVASGHGSAPGSELVRALESDQRAGAVLSYAESVVCARAPVACPQLHGDYTIGGNRPCRPSDPSARTTGELVHAAAHPDDTAPVQTGVRPCDEPTASERAHELAAAADAAFTGLA